MDDNYVLSPPQSVVLVSLISSDFGRTGKYLLYHGMFSNKPLMWLDNRPVNDVVRAILTNIARSPVKKTRNLVFDRLID